MFNQVLIIDGDDALRESFELSLAGEPYRIHTADSGERAFELLEAFEFHAVVCDLQIPGLDDFDLISQIARRFPTVPIILSTHGTEDLALESMRRGTYTYLAEPFRPADIRLAIRNARERDDLRRGNLLLQRDLSRAIGSRAIVGASDGMIELLELLERTAAYDSMALVIGERGSGREGIARAIHAQSPRRHAPFVAVDCGAIPEDLVESTLFGHVKGAFPGATRARRGLFAEADRGTLFLHEVESLPLSIQSKLIGAAQEEEIWPVGDSKPQRIDVRILAATTRDLEAESAAGRFHADLFERLNVVRLEVPPLRARRDDIPLLVDHCLARFRETMGNSVRRVSDAALECLIAYSWPGNVQELENVIERAVILTDRDTIECSVLPDALRKERAASDLDSHRVRDVFCMKKARQRFEADLIRRALSRTHGNRTHAAKLLEISHRALLYKIKDYGIRD